VTSYEGNGAIKPKRKRKLSGIAAWPKDERPRERLLANGPHTLTGAELLAILLRIGGQGKSAIELGRELLQRFGSIKEMMSAPLSAWVGFKGLGGAKLAQLLAALELGRRAALPGNGGKITIKSTQQAAKYFIARLRGLSEEFFRVVYLNRQGRLLDDALLAEGTVDSVHPPIRSIVARALQVNASSLIAAHNHPSGAPEPSEADKLLTRDLIAACHPIGVKVLEHLIVAADAHFSFADTGLLDELGLQTLAPLPAKR
jgi:DNA repair protein RadC